MPLYSYKAKDSKGKVVEDVVQASSRKEAASIIGSNGFKILTIKNIQQRFNASIGGSIKISEKAAFCRFMATMLRAGLPMTEAVDNIREETKNPKLKKILFDVSFQIRKGASLSSVLSKYKKDFDNFFLTMVKAGEKTGTIDQSFDYLSKQLLASHELDQKIKGAMMYPIIIVIAMLGNAVIMITFVLPKISGVFTELNVDLPAATKIMLSVGNFIGNNTLLTLLIMVGVLIATISLFLIRATRSLIFRAFLKLPLVKALVINIDVARYSRTISTLLQSGVPITVALETSAGVLRTPKLAAKAAEFCEGVSRGEQLSDMLLTGKRVFPTAVIQTIRAGEKSGNLGEVLAEMSNFYESEVDYSLKRVTALIEPILMLVIGVAVGGLVLMMITPIYSLIGGFDNL
ncbi:type II secretion system F family protein [Candidatus Woesebacteria bacterium]|nr:MAG: type II secretion system F family protein [Candidatus Woesebacteria bacterium]